jgi:hypothetical protein
MRAIGQEHVCSCNEVHLDKLGRILQSASPQAPARLIPFRWRFEIVGSGINEKR